MQISVKIIKMQAFKQPKVLTILKFSQAVVQKCSVNFAKFTGKQLF